MEGLQGKKKENNKEIYSLLCNLRNTSFLKIHKQKTAAFVRELQLKSWRNQLKSQQHQFYRNMFFPYAETCWSFPLCFSVNTTLHTTNTTCNVVLLCIRDLSIWVNIRVCAVFSDSSGSEDFWNKVYSNSDIFHRCLNLRTCHNAILPQEL